MSRAVVSKTTTAEVQVLSPLPYYSPAVQPGVDAALSRQISRVQIPSGLHKERNYNMRVLNGIETEEYTLEVIECDCGFHIGLDATYLDQVDSIDTMCPSCGEIIRARSWLTKRRVG